MLFSSLDCRFIDEKHTNAWSLSLSKCDEIPGIEGKKRTLQNEILYSTRRNYCS